MKFPFIWISRISFACLLFTAFLALLVTSVARRVHAQQDSKPVGIFDASGSVGETPRIGSIAFDAASGEYRITGGGENIWGASDAFEFAWKRISGDVRISADVQFIGPGAVEHRKAVLMVRETLDAGSAYADVALHGSGLTSLQYRLAPSADTQELKSTVNAPLHVQIERRGDEFTMFAGKPGDPLTVSGPVRVALANPVYVGLGVSSHDAHVLETAIFKNVRIEKIDESNANPSHVRSSISIYDLATKTVRLLYAADTLWEAPTWSPDGKYLLANSGGRLYRFALDAAGAGQARPDPIALDARYLCNNDKGISPDGKTIAFSATDRGSQGSQVFVADSAGSSPRLIVATQPSYFHAWSPDGNWLAFVGQRNGSFNIFRVAASGGVEQRLTSAAGYDDGPDYSPDGKWIYINSRRSEKWEIWRFPAQGAGAADAQAERVTNDEWENWFPHPSPDGHWLLILSFPHGTPGHDAKTMVRLRIMPLPGTKTDAIAATPSIQSLEEFYGGQGTINVNSWSPDSKKFAYVSYQPLSGDQK